MEIYNNEQADEFARRADFTPLQCMEGFLWRKEDGKRRRFLESMFFKQSELLPGNYNYTIQMSPENSNYTIDIVCSELE